MKVFILLALASLFISGCITPPPFVDTEWETAKSKDIVQSYEYYVKNHKFSSNAVIVEHRAIAEQRIADLKEKDLATFRRLFSGAKTLSLKETNVSADKEEWLTKHPLNRNQLNVLLDTAGLTLTESNADVAVWIEYKAIPSGSLYEYRDIILPSGERKFAGTCYVGAYARGSVCIGGPTARMCTKFSGGGEDIGAGKGRSCPRNAKDAPYSYAFEDSGLKDQLVYLLTQFKGNSWTKQIPPEAFGNLFNLGWGTWKDEEYDRKKAEKNASTRSYGHHWDFRIVVTRDERERTTPE